MELKKSQDKLTKQKQSQRGKVLGAGEMGEDVNHMVVDGETRGDHFSVHKCSITVIYT